MLVVAPEVPSYVDERCEKCFTWSGGELVREAEAITESAFLAFKTIQHIRAAQTEDRALDAGRYVRIYWFVEILIEAR